MKISIVGCGRVGSTIAYSLLHVDKVNEINLEDIDVAVRSGNVLDLRDAVEIFDMGKHKYITENELEESDIVIITAGVARKEPDESDDQLFIKNWQTMIQIRKDTSSQ